MARFVALQDVVQAMAEHAPRSWCKLAILGALHTHQVRLYSVSGRIRAYLPRYYLRPKDEVVPSFIASRHDLESLVDRYYLREQPRPNTADIELWEDQWTNEPRHIAAGWLIFEEVWDWDAPRLSYERFDIPRDCAFAFSCDDIHSEGDPEAGVTFDAAFEKLAIDLQQAELLVPMANFDGIAIASKDNPPTQRVGRPRGSGYSSADEAIITKMLSDLLANPAETHRRLAMKYASEAIGHGTEESKIKRLERRLREVV